MVRNAVEKNMVDSLEVGTKKIQVNMIQYADDTLFSAKRISKVCLI